MKLNVFTGKNYEEVESEALNNLGLTKEDVVISKKTKKSLFKNQVELIVTPLTDILEFSKEYIKELFKTIGIDVNFESRIENNQIQIKMHTEDSPIIIGYGGKNLQALQTVMRGVVKNEFGATPYISLDVGNYKDRQIKNIERMAKRISKEVSKTGIPVELDNMNSYERLIVHNIVAKFDKVISESEGEEPNRRVWIKPKE